MKSKYSKAVCLFGLCVSVCVLQGLVWEYVPNSGEKLGALAMLLLFGVASLGLGLLCGEDEK